MGEAGVYIYVWVEKRLTQKEGQLFSESMAKDYCHEQVFEKIR